MKYLPPVRYVSINAEPIYSKIDSSVIEQTFRDQEWGLPSDYAAFLEEWNGFQFSGNIAVHFPVARLGAWGRMTPNWPPAQKVLQRDNANSARLGFLSGINSNNNEDIACDLLQNQTLYSFQDFVPKNFIRIGGGEFDDSLAIAVTGPHFGIVAYFAGAEANWPVNGKPERTVTNLAYIAPTFRAFWNSLTTVPIT